MKLLIIAMFSMLVIFFTNSETHAQVLISDTGGNPDESAMLEIQSNSKGLLIPRLSTAQRLSLASTAADGLLIFDYETQSFYIFGKGKWTDLSVSSEIWEQKNNMVYLTNSNFNVGIGTNSPNRKLVIQANNDTDTLLEVLDQNGNPLMIITPKLTKFNFIETTKGVSGGFSVGRYSPFKKTKGLNDTTLFLVTPDSTRVYTSPSSTEPAGFAVGSYADVNGKQSYIKKYFFTDIDSTRVYANDNGKGVSGGFAVGRYDTYKGTSDKYAHFTMYNSFIGYMAGTKTTTGQNNIFIGQNSGSNNTSGSNNVYIGNQSGGNFLMTSGSGNIFIGNQSGPTALENDKLYINNGSGDKDNTLIYGDFSTGSETVFLNGTLRFNRGSLNTITMPTTRGNLNEVLTIGSGGNTSWKDVSSLITFPETYVPPIIYTNLDGDYVFNDKDNIGTFIEKTNTGILIKERLPSISTSGDNYNRIIKLKNDQDRDNMAVYPFDGNDFIEGGYSDEIPLIIKPGETYTLQAGGKEIGINTWFIIDYTNDEIERNLLKEIIADYDFENDPSGDGPKVYTLIINSTAVSSVILPDAKNYPNRIIVVKNNVIEGGKAYIYPQTGNTIDGNSVPVPTTQTLLYNESFMFQSDGLSNWYIINHYTP